MLLSGRSVSPWLRCFLVWRSVVLLCVVFAFWTIAGVGERVGGWGGGGGEGKRENLPRTVGVFWLPSFHFSFSKTPSTVLSCIFSFTDSFRQNLQMRSCDKTSFQRRVGVFLFSCPVQFCIFANIFLQDYHAFFFFFAITSLFRQKDLHNTFPPTSSPS